MEWIVRSYKAKLWEFVVGFVKDLVAKGLWSSLSGSRVEGL